MMRAEGPVRAKGLWLQGIHSGALEEAGVKLGQEEERGGRRVSAGVAAEKQPVPGKSFSFS